MQYLPFLQITQKSHMCHRKTKFWPVFPTLWYLLWLFVFDYDIFFSPKSRALISPDILIVNPAHYLPPNYHYLIHWSVFSSLFFCIFALLFYIFSLLQDIFLFSESYYFFLVQSVVPPKRGKQSSFIQIVTTELGPLPSAHFSTAW